MVQSLLLEIRQQFLATTRAWNTFSAPNGDIAYFTDIRENDIIQIALQEIRDSFAELKLMEQRLEMLAERFEESAKMVRHTS